MSGIDMVGVNEHCPLCRSTNFAPVYVPDGTRREATVNLCECGMLFSTYGKQPPYERIQSISHKADFGNLRTGKGQRTQANLKAIQSFMFDPPLLVLDVGANRGAFVKAMLDWNPNCSITAVEPDATVTDWWLDTSGNIELWHSRIEDVTLMAGAYDLIYCSHTLEHLADPLLVLAKLREALAPDGLVFIEVPDVYSLMQRSGIIEELFLDKHDLHFSYSIFVKMMYIAGFDCVSIHQDGENISAIAKPDRYPYSAKVILSYTKPNLDSIRKAVSSYQINRQRALTRLADTATRWNQIAAEKKVAVWGIGRIFSAMVEAGLDADRFTALVDGYLPDGFKWQERGIDRPLSLVRQEPDIVMACSRVSLDEIRERAGKLLGNKVAVVGYEE